MKSGSALLLVILFLSSIILVGITLWQKVGFLVDLTGTLYQQEKISQATNAALEWAIALYKEYPEQIENYLKNHEQCDLALKNWLDEQDCTALITIFANNDASFCIRAHLESKTMRWPEISCCIRLRSNSAKNRRWLHVFNWHQQSHSS